MEDMPATASRPPPSTMRHHGCHLRPLQRVITGYRRIPVAGLRPRPTRSRLETSLTVRATAIQEQSKYSQEDADPLNGGPPPMSRRTWCTRARAAHDRLAAEEQSHAVQAAGGRETQTPSAAQL
ncbi:hypothetical protein GQ600_7475 [Phytophthora cactorum]|nr:hypothetical protein GQ600_7475 [Phytophthora cactorum]